MLIDRLIFGGGGVAAASACAIVLPAGHGFSIVAPIAALFLVLTGRVQVWHRASWGGSCLSCGQAAFVLLVFAMPLNLVPLAATICGLLQGRLRPGEHRGPVMRTLIAAANGWYALPPVVLLSLLAPGRARWGHGAVYLIAFSAQFLTDALIDFFRGRIRRESWTLANIAAWRIDVVLTPIGLAAAVSMSAGPVGPVLIMGGVTGLVLTTGREYQQRRAHAERALRDPLTGLANRALFDETAQAVEARCRRDRIHAGMLLIDLDDFKSINDTRGHQAGDETLCALALADGLRAVVRGVDLPARLGGDEFAVLLAGPTSEDGSQQVVEKLRRHFDGPITLAGGETVEIRFSVGAALLGDGVSIQQALLEADTALYTDKRQRKRAMVCP